MPKEMGAIGTNMHKAASRFALAAKDAELDGGLNKAFSALSEVMQFISQITWMFGRSLNHLTFALFSVISTD